MFGGLVPVKDCNNVFHLVWTNIVKDLDPCKKVRCACDDSMRGRKVRILNYTYANCADHMASWMFYANSAAESVLVYREDVCNMFSTAPAPCQGFYLQPDWAFAEWWIIIWAIILSQRDMLSLLWEQCNDIRSHQGYERSGVTHLTAWIQSNHAWTIPLLGC